MTRGKLEWNARGVRWHVIFVPPSLDIHSKATGRNTGIAYTSKIVFFCERRFNTLGCITSKVCVDLHINNQYSYIQGDASLPPSRHLPI